MISGQHNFGCLMEYLSIIIWIKLNKNRIPSYAYAIWSIIVKTKVVNLVPYRLVRTFRNWYCGCLILSRSTLWQVSAVPVGSGRFRVSQPIPAIRTSQHKTKEVKDTHREGYYQSQRWFLWGFLAYFGSFTVLQRETSVKNHLRTSQCSSLLRRSSTFGSEAFRLPCPNN